MTNKTAQTKQSSQTMNKIQQIMQRANQQINIFSRKKCFSNNKLFKILRFKTVPVVTNRTKQMTVMVRSELVRTIQRGPWNNPAI